MRRHTPGAGWHRFKATLPLDRRTDEITLRAFATGGITFLQFITARASPAFTQAVSDELIAAGKAWVDELAQEPLRVTTKQSKRRAPDGVR